MKKTVVILVALAVAGAISLIGSQGLLAVMEDRVDEQIGQWEAMKNEGEALQGENEEELAPEGEEQIEEEELEEEGEDRQEETLPFDETDTPDSEKMFIIDTKD